MTTKASVRERRSIDPCIVCEDEMQDHGQWHRECADGMCNADGVTSVVVAAVAAEENK